MKTLARKFLTIVLVAAIAITAVAAIIGAIAPDPTP